MRHFVLLALLLQSATALAQEETPTPTPIDSEAPRKRASIPEPGITPSFGLLQGHVFTRDRSLSGNVGYLSTLPIYAGVTLHAMPARISPFSNVGIEMDYMPWSGRVEWVPMGRFGVAFLTRGDVGSEFLRRLLPTFQVYTLAGYRIPTEDRGGAARLGLGIGSPFLMAATMGERCVPAPTMLEATMDVSDFEGGRRDYQLRLGWFF